MKNKNTFSKVLVFILFVLPLVGQAQRIEITPTGGYMFGGKIRAYEGDFKITDKGSYGGAIGYSVDDWSQMEFFYMRQSSEGRLRTFGVFDSETLFDLVTEYYQVGVVRNFQEGEVQPFGSISFGATRFHPVDSEFDDEWFFSSTLGLGVKTFFNESVGLRLQARLMVPMYFGGGGLWCGTGGCGVGVSTYAPIVQGDLTAGLIIAIDR